MLTWGMQKLYPYDALYNKISFVQNNPASEINNNGCCLNRFVQVNKIFSENAFDAVMHFAAVAYVGESTLDPLK